MWNMCEKYFKRILIVGVVNEFQFHFSLYTFGFECIGPHLMFWQRLYSIIFGNLWNLFLLLKMSAVHPHAVISQLDFKAWVEEHPLAKFTEKLCIIVWEIISMCCGIVSIAMTFYGVEEGTDKASCRVHSLQTARISVNIF